MKSLSVFFLIFAMLLSLSACASTVPNLTPEQELTADDAQAILGYLTSAQLQGRSLGSAGNEAAAHTIADILQALGYTPFADEYCIAYSDFQIRPELSQASLTLIAADGARTELIEGEDFIYTPTFTAMDVTIPTSGDNSHSITLLCADSDTAMSLNNSVNADGDTRIEVDDRFAEILAQSGTQAEIHLTPNVKTAEAYNVAAIRRGTKGSQAVILSAHFDGSGCYGEMYYPSAYDNASGVTTMLLAAQLLSQSHLEADLIFAAFNGEEEWLHGSTALAQTLCEGYDSVTVINIDCIGLSTETGFTLSGNTAEFSAFAQMLDNYTPCKVDMNSDHLSFDAIANATATNFADANAMDYAETLMHTRGDSADNISPERLLHAAKLVTQYVCAGSYPVRESAPENQVCLFQIPCQLDANSDANMEFFRTLPRNFGTAYDSTYNSFEQLQSQMGIHPLRPTQVQEADSLNFSVFSQTDQDADTEPAYEVNGYYYTDEAGISVWNEVHFSVGQSIDSSLWVYGKEGSVVTQSQYHISALDVEATLYQVDDGNERKITAFFILDNILYTCEMEADIEQMQQYLENFQQ